MDTETDPEALFNMLLMHVRPEGTVTPHLIDFLRWVQENQQVQRSVERLRQEVPAATVHWHGEQQLYTEFQALMLERERDD